VDFQSLINPVDIQLLIAMFRFTQSWLSMPSNLALGAVEGPPTVTAISDDEIEAFLRILTFSSISYPAGTNAMMPQKLGGVVSSELLVYGVKGLSVVDSSIIPMIPATHLRGTVYAVAEKVSYQDFEK